MDFESTKDGYRNLYAAMVVLPSKQNEATITAKACVKYQDRYKGFFNIPWYFLAILHIRESGLNRFGSPRFDCYIGNGQPLNRVTTAVPVGRGPFDTFEAGVIDAMVQMGYDKITDWSIEHMLFLFEKFNGAGYFGHGVNSPYVWSFSNLYKVGKYDVDGHFVSILVDDQPGCAVLLKLILGILGMGTETAAVTPETPVQVNTVITNQREVFIHHLLTAVGVALAALGWAHAADIYNGLVNSQVIGGLIVAGIGYMLNAIGVNNSNSNTLQLLDNIVSKLAGLGTKQ